MVGKGETPMGLNLSLGAGPQGLGGPFDSLCNPQPPFSEPQFFHLENGAHIRPVMIYYKPKGEGWAGKTLILPTPWDVTLNRNPELCAASVSSSVKWG